MAMNSGEQGIVSSLQSAVALFRANLSTFIPDIYGYETSLTQSQLTAWWQNQNNNIIIQPGFTKGSVKGMSWNVIMGPEQEASGHQVAGSSAYTIGGTQTQGTPFDSSYTVGILGIGQDWLRWSSMLCKWALLYYRIPLEQQYGLLHQRLSSGALQPAPDDLRDSLPFPFMRTVTLTAEHMDTWNQLSVPTITAASITTNPTFD